MGRLQNVDMDADWLKAELQKYRRSQSALARHLGVVPEIVNRIVNNRRQVKANEADKIREYLEATERDYSGTTEASGMPVISRLARSSFPTSSLPVKGTVEAGSWREVAYMEQNFETETLIAPQSVVDSGAFALRVAGPSMDQLYPDGSYVVVQPWFGGPLPYGRRVIVERIDAGGKIETTVKEMVKGADGEPELWPRSNHPAHQTPLSYKVEETTVRLVGVVIWRMQPD